MIPPHSAHRLRRRRAAVAAALTVPIATLASVAVPASPAGARGVHERSAPLRRSAASDIDGLAGTVAPPSSAIYALDWEPGHPHRRSWARLLDTFLGEIGAEGLSAAPTTTGTAAARSRSGARGGAATVTRTETARATSPSSSTPSSAFPPVSSVSTTVAVTSSEAAEAPAPAAARSPSGPVPAANQGVPHTPPRLLVTALPLTSSLPHALKKGLSVRYSVSQQVAGYFELLMARRVARRLHIHPQRSRWLQGGGRGQTLIAYRLLVTTRGAHGRIQITIPAKAAARLRGLTHLRLTLRVMVRNAALRRPKIVHLRSVLTLKRPPAVHAIRTHRHNGG